MKPCRESQPIFHLDSSSAWTVSDNFIRSESGGQGREQDLNLEANEWRDKLVAQEGLDTAGQRAGPHCAGLAHFAGSNADDLRDRP